MVRSLKSSTLGVWLEVLGMGSSAFVVGTVSFKPKFANNLGTWDFTIFLALGSQKSLGVSSITAVESADEDTVGL